MSAPRQRIRLAVADIAARHFEVQQEIDHDGGPLLLKMPSWVPGSYLMREYPGLVVRVDAEDAAGAPLQTRKLDKNTWRLESAGPTTVRIRARVFAPELTVRSSDITPEHAFVHPPATFFYVEGRRDEAISLQIDVPDGWRVSTALEERDGVYWADDYDRLADCPIELGPHRVHRFELAGRPHEFVVHGTGNADIERILADTEKICRTEIEFFGEEPPYERYLFILHLVHDRGGGLEHADSSALAWPKLGFRPDKEYRKFLTLVAHEFFHVWNVKRIRPEVLLRYEYTHEIYTRLLWLFEGWTTYYDEVFPMRAGCYGAREMLESMAENIAVEKSRPGGRIQSLSESSFDTWIKLYRPNPDTQNTQTNYYLKGLLVGWLLDLHLRRVTGGRRSLDDVMRHLWNEVYRRGSGVPEDGAAALIEAATGVDVRAFLQTHVERPGALNYDEALASIGLRLRRKSREKDQEEPAWLGASIEKKNGRSRLAVVYHGGPAHGGGLMAGDEVLALDGHRVGSDLAERVELYRPGETATWAVFRADRLVEGRIRFGEDPVGKLEIVPLPSIDESQRAAFAAWSGTDGSFLDSQAKD